MTAEPKRYYPVPEDERSVVPVLMRVLSAEDLEFVHESYPLHTEKLTLAHDAGKNVFALMYYVRGTPFVNWVYTNGAQELETRMRVLFDAGEVGGWLFDDSAGWWRVTLRAASLLSC